VEQVNRPFSSETQVGAYKDLFSRNANDSMGFKV